MSHWPLDDGLALDVVGPNDATVVGATSIAGKIGGAFHFGSASDVISSPYDSSVDVSQMSGMSVEAWLRFPQLPPVSQTYLYIVAKEENLGGLGVSFFLTVRQHPALNGGQPFFTWIVCQPGGVCNDFEGAPYVTVSANTDWQHVAGTYDATTGTAKLFVNGLLARTWSMSPGALVNDPTHGVRIGGAVGNFGSHSVQPYDIDDVSLYARVLGSDEVLQHYESAPFVDDFNRPDGVVGNGWAAWGGGAAISGNELVTYGLNGVAGGISRILPVTFPVSFAFDFRTGSPGDGGWDIRFNTPGSNPGDSRELELYHFRGNASVAYQYQTAGGSAGFNVPLVDGQTQDYRSDASAHVAGVVQADLSASVTITYADGSHATFATPAPVDALIQPQGSILVVGNANAAFGPHYFDNLVIDQLPASFNTNIGSDVAVEVPVTLPSGSSGSVTLMFDNVTTAGETTVTTSSAGAPPPTGFKLTSPPVYYEISTTATFTGNVRVCLHWAEGQVVNENKVRLFHHEGGVWVDITDVTSRDTVANTVCGDTTSLSPFTLFEEKYTFTGFFSPIENAPAVNSVKAGAAVPVKFSLGGNQGLNIFAPGYPQAQQIQPISGAVLGVIEETTSAGNSSLSYDPSTGIYTYVWKTDKSWAGSWRELRVKLSDGEIYTAKFMFR